MLFGKFTILKFCILSKKLILHLEILFLTLFVIGNDPAPLGF
jgi:hypothetical protein